MELRILRLMTARHDETCLPQLVRRAEEREGTRFHGWSGRRCLAERGGRNVEGETWSEGKGWRAKRLDANDEEQQRAAASKSVVVGALVQISAWFTPIHARREREKERERTRRSNGRRSEASTRARAADVRAFRVHSTKYHLKLSVLCASVREITRGISTDDRSESGWFSVFFFFLLSGGFLWW